MRKVVRDDFFDFSAKREGFTPFMYCDTLNLVTTGIGNLIDSSARNSFDISAGAMAPAMNLPWQHKGPGWNPKNPVTDGIRASQSEVADAWITTKLQEQRQPGFNKKGGFAYQNLTSLSLDLEGLHTFFNRTLDSFDKSLQSDVHDKTGKLIRGPYTSYATAPADAQKALLSMSWAMGPAFKFDAFKAAFDRRDFDSAAKLSFFKGGGGTEAAPSGRNAENQIMFHNAAVVERSGADPDRLYFPGTVGGPGGQGSPLVANLGGLNTGISAATAGKVMVGTAAVGAGGWGLYSLWKKYFK